MTLVSVVYAFPTEKESSFPHVLASDSIRTSDTEHFLQCVSRTLCLWPTLHLRILCPAPGNRETRSRSDLTEGVKDGGNPGWLTEEMTHRLALSGQLCIDITPPCLWHMGHVGSLGCGSCCQKSRHAEIGAVRFALQRS